MSLTINTNIEALDAQRNLSSTESSLAMSMERLSSGLKINSAADDVAGYAINERLQSQITGLEQAQQNSQDAVALSQTGQGALNEVEQMLQRVRELAVQYENGTNSTSDKEALESETTQLNAEIKRVGETTSFNGISLLSKTGEITFQVGANEGKEEQIKVKTIKLSESVKEVKLAGEEKEEEVENAKKEKRKSKSSRLGHQTGRRLHRRSCEGSRRIRLRPGPSAVHAGQPGHLHSEPDRGTEFNRRRRHGVRSDELHQGPGPRAGRRVSPHAGQLAPPGRPEASGRLR